MRVFGASYDSYLLVYLYDALLLSVTAVHDVQQVTS